MSTKVSPSPPGSPSSSPKLRTKPPIPPAPPDEYPSQPTVYFFLLKALIGVVALLVLGIAWILKPNDCFGICFVDPELHHGCPAYDPPVLFYPRTRNSHDGYLISSLLKGRESKGFNHIHLASYDEATFNDNNDFYNKLCARLGIGTPFHLKTKSNRTFFEGRVFSVDFEACLGQPSSLVATVGLVRKPRDVLKQYFDSLNFTLLSFADCIRDLNCIKNLRLDRICASQTRTFCGFAEECETPQGLERAKRNIDASILVGIAEDPVAVVSLARRILPTYFEFVSVFNKPSSMTNLTRQLSQTLDELCAVDNSLYDHAVNVFAEKAHHCGVAFKAVKTKTDAWQYWFW